MASRRSQKAPTEKAKLFKWLSYDPLPKQKEFHFAHQRFKGYIGGLGSGKSHSGVFEAIYYLTRYPGITLVILAPTVRVLHDSTIKAFMNFCPEDWIKDYNRSSNNIKFFNGSEVLFRNCEDERSIDRLRNMEIGGFWIDEARGVPEYAWKVLVGRLRQKGMPLVGWITTTPKGYNWIYTRFVDTRDPNFVYVTASSRQNVHLPEDYVGTLESEYAGKFSQQEIEGHFVGFEGVVYEAFSRDTHLLKKTPEIGQFKEIVLGIDWGFTNPTAIVVVGLDEDRRMYVIDEFYEKKVMIDQLRQVLEEYKKKYDYAYAYADPSQPTFIEDLNRNGLRIKKANNAVIPGIAEVSAKLQIQADKRPRLYINEQCHNIIREFETYRYLDAKEDKPEKDNPLKVDDHLMDALRYVSMSIKTSGFSVRGG